MFDFIGGVRISLLEPDSNALSGSSQDTLELRDRILAIADHAPPVSFVKNQEQQMQCQTQQQIDVLQYLTEIWVPVSSVAIPALAGLAGAWLQAKLGRRVSMEVGNVKLEASNIDEVRQLLLLKVVLAQMEEEAIQERLQDVPFPQTVEEKSAEAAAYVARIEAHLADLAKSYERLHKFKTLSDKET